MKMTCVAEKLTEARKSLNLSIDDVSRATRISAALIDALENNDFGKFTAAFYARGCVAILARYYRLDHRQLKRQFSAELPSYPPWRTRSAKTEVTRDETDWWCYWLASLRLEIVIPWALAFVVLFLVLSAYSLGYSHGTSRDHRKTIDNGYRQPLASHRPTGFAPN